MIPRLKTLPLGFQLLRQFELKSPGGAGSGRMMRQGYRRKDFAEPPTALRQPGRTQLVVGPRPADELGG
eukprot:768338-Hanusia_phi.AAC.6